LHKSEYGLTSGKAVARSALVNVEPTGNHSPSMLLCDGLIVENKIASERSANYEKPREWPSA